MSLLLESKWNDLSRIAQVSLVAGLRSWFMRLLDADSVLTAKMSPREEGKKSSEKYFLREQSHKKIINKTMMLTNKLSFMIHLKCHPNKKATS